MTYAWQWNSLLPYRDTLLRAAFTTLELTFLVVIGGLVLGLGFALLDQASRGIGRRLLRTLVEFLRAIPILVLLIWIHYVLPLLAGIQLSAFQSAFLALTLNLSAFVTETIRAGIQSIPSHQRESGLALGLNESQVLHSIILPQTLKNVLPNLVNLSITQLKNTALASVIGVNELLHQGNVVISNTFRPLEIYTAVAGMYTLLIVPLALLGKRLERRLYAI